MTKADKKIIVHVVRGRDDDARIQSYQFDTERERRAFFAGVDEADGWTRFESLCHATDGEVGRLPSIVDISKGDRTA